MIQIVLGKMRRRGNVAYLLTSSLFSFFFVEKMFKSFVKEIYLKLNKEIFSFIFLLRASFLRVLM